MTARQKRWYHWLLLFCICVHAQAAAGAVVEEAIEVPVAVRNIYGQETSRNIIVTVWRDDARARAPFLIVNHGRPARAADFPTLGRQRYAANSAYFVSRGFVVLVPTRVGYGPTGGDDVEYSGPCQRRNYPPVFRAAADQTLAVLAHARTLPWVEGSRGIVVGQSFGGAAALAVASLNAEGVVAVVNFAGGSGGNPQDAPGRPCRSDLLERVFAGYGATARVPSLWLYSENDRYWGSELPRRWFDAYTRNGARAKFIALPPYEQDGHPSFTRNPEAWKPAFEAFLRELGF